MRTARQGGRDEVELVGRSDIYIYDVFSTLLDTEWYRSLADRNTSKSPPSESLAQRQFHICTPDGVRDTE